MKSIVVEEKKDIVQGVEILAPVEPKFERILTRDALEFVAALTRKFGSEREKILQERTRRQSELDNGILPNFLKETESIRSAMWAIAPVPTDLLDRRVEITGPSGDTKMVINAFNSGANVYMADFEDAQSPTWKETIQGQVNLMAAVDGSLTYINPEGKKYSLNEKVATLFVRPRGWHLEEKHVRIDGKPVSASLFDFALFFYHNARELIQSGSGPYFYLPKLESHLEARLWNNVFVAAENELGLPLGTVKATVLIETILAAFEMDEILYELREHSAGLNCGRWDYIFSFIKKFRNNPNYVLPNRSQVTMDKAFLAAYVSLLIRTCHKRGAHAIGGMSAFIPVKNDEEANRLAFDQVRADKEREVRAGHDGTWVAHPGLVALARSVFDKGMSGKNQINNLGEGNVSRDDLLKVPIGEITEGGIRTNIKVGVQYLEAWLRGKGSVPLNNLMEDAATAEICRAQLWQWVHHNAVISDGGNASETLVRTIMKQELDNLEATLGREIFHERQYLLASEIFGRLVVSKEFPEFLTSVAYEHLLALENNSVKQ